MGVWRIAATPLLAAATAGALERPDVTYKVFQFPADKIPRVDGNADDWAMVPEDYVYGTDLLADDTKKHAQPDPKTLDVRVRVGWVKGLNRLYFLYEAYDDYWDFARPDLHNDTFEIVVDGDLSGGPLIDQGHPDAWKPEGVGAARSRPDPRLAVADAHYAFHGVHAQNYHIFTPAEGKDWALAWGSQPWIKELPYANAATSYSFRPGQGGRLVLEFWITPFDYAGPDGPVRAVESVLKENKLIGLAWAIIDYDDVDKRDNNGFWNLSPRHTMYGNADQLLGFRLMPIEPQFRKPLDAQWTFTVIDRERRLVAFQDLSYGKIAAWRWDFGDGETSTEQHPVHQFKRGGNLVVILDVTGPEGQARRSKVWDVQVR
jgi:PKD domain